MKRSGIRDSVAHSTEVPPAPAAVELACLLHAEWRAVEGRTAIIFGTWTKNLSICDRSLTHHAKQLFIGKVGSETLEFGNEIGIDSRLLLT